MSARRDPRISLCVPTYNRAALLRRCVSTLAAQSAGDVEIVVVDDCSSDGTPRVASEFEGDSRFRYIRGSSNVGPQRNWSRCVEAARGQYVAICHDDDFYSPAFAERSAGFLDRHASVGFVHSAFYVTNGAGTPIRSYCAYPRDRVIPGPECFVQFLRDSHNVAFSSVMARKSAYEAVGAFRDGLIAGDYDMWLRLAFRFDVGFISQKLLYYTNHESSLSGNTPLTQWYEEHVDIIDHALAMAGDSALPVTRDELVRGAAELWTRRGFREAISRAAQGNVAGAHQYLSAARSLAPSERLRVQVRLAGLFLSPVGVALLQPLRSVLHRVRQRRVAAP